MNHVEELFATLQDIFAFARFVEKRKTEKGMVRVRSYVLVQSEQYDQMVYRIVRKEEDKTEA